jgi:hypothetical protein
MTGRIDGEPGSAGPRPIAHTSGSLRSSTDASCLHAALGTLLLDQDPDIDLPGTLGNFCGTRATGTEHGPRFEMVLPGLVAAIESRGHRVLRYPLQENQGRRALFEAVAAGKPVVVDADTFYLDHYWLDRNRAHSLHAVVARQFDPAGATVHITDPMDVTYFEGRRPWASLEVAFTRSSIGQSWLHVEQAPAPPTWTRPQLARELSRHAITLSKDGDEALGGVSLATDLRSRLPGLFSAPHAPPLVQADWLAELSHGLWTYHHTLRWFARYLASIAETAHPVAAAAPIAERASQDWLVVRSLLRHVGSSDPVRSIRYRDELGHRLDRIVSDLCEVARLITPAEVSPT